MKKEGDKVYTATKDKAQKLEANTPPLPAPAPLFKDENVQVSENQVESVATPVSEDKPKSKRGRKPGSKNKTTLEKSNNQIKKIQKKQSKKK